MKITLARGLLYKKRVIEKIELYGKLIQQNNSVVVVNDKANRNYDPKDLFETRLKLVDFLIDFKTKLWKASEPIRLDILSLAEFKTSLIFIQGIKTTDGEFRENSGYSGPSIVRYDAVFKEDKTNELKIAITSKIDNIQAKIDEFNNSTHIDFEDILATLKV